MSNSSTNSVLSNPIRSIGVIGSRSLAYDQAEKVGQVTNYILSRGFHIATGGAMGTDQFCLNHLLNTNQSQNATIYSAWQTFAGFPAKVRTSVREFKDLGGSVLWGPIWGGEPAQLVKVALLNRNERLVEACYGLVVFLTGGSKGSLFTLKKGLEKRMPVVVFPTSAKATAGTPLFDVSLLPETNYVRWKPLHCGGCFEGAFKPVYLK